MKVAGIIAEYNPFHNGHAYHIEETRKKTGADYIIAVMSGNFVQRGAPAILNKYTRTAMALAHGADLVIELPAVAAQSSAEHFALGGVRLLDGLGIVQYLSFGCEASNPTEKNLLRQAAALLSQEPLSYQQMLREQLKCGLSYPAARQKALLAHINGPSDTLPDFRIEEILGSPNNILAMEYLKALKSCHSSIEPCMITRQGSHYHDQSISGSLSSASAIRNMLTDSAQRFSTSHPQAAALQNAVPASVYQILHTCADQQSLLTEQDFSSVLYFALAEHFHELSSFGEIGEDFASRIQNSLEDFTDWKSFASLLKTKNRTYTSISRAFAHLLNGIDTKILKTASDCQFAPYAHILGFQKTAGGLLKEIKNNARIPVIQKFAADIQNLDENLTTLLSVDLRCSRNYNHILYERSGIRQLLDYRQPLVIR